MNSDEIMLKIMLGLAGLLVICVIVFFFWLLSTSFRETLAATSIMVGVGGLCYFIGDFIERKVF